ncbi:AAA family ATPase [Flectobacillus roseus]|uniref:AAA family ATPase n=1 Tax=Flectobacillus roseus TaxID=502259 RepID=UPI0024B66D93|nr:ATP-binding protein [Flectobacillus roseus]MDI9868469.1 AAA family ATPase [Flectobacillus roseus]
MNEPIKYIKKVEIKNLWGRYDLEWNLDPSVNVLSGINGSGKSTILGCIASIVKKGTLDPELKGKKINQIGIIFNNDDEITFRRVKDSIKNLQLTANDDKGVYGLISELREKEGENYKNIKTVEFGVTSFENASFNSKNLPELLEFDVISTFDKLLNQNDSPHANVRTELDKDIFFLTQKYLAYQNNILNRTVKVLSNGNVADLELINNITHKRERFLDIIDTLFKDTGKKVDRNIDGNNTDIAFVNETDTLTPYQLSSGEKQIIVILLTVLVQDNKPAILFMDEPEISLHIDWQRKLIQYIKELNPNVQIILATHSPGIILEGWTDKVFEVSDLITLDRQAISEDAK